MLGLVRSFVAPITPRLLNIQARGYVQESKDHLASMAAHLEAYMRHIDIAADIIQGELATLRGDISRLEAACDFGLEELLGMKRGQANRLKDALDAVQRAQGEARHVDNELAELRERQAAVGKPS